MMASTPSTARTSVTALTAPIKRPSRTRGCPRGRLIGKVGEERLEFPVGPGCVQRLKPLFKLAPAEPPLSRGMSQPFGNLLPIGV